MTERGAGERTLALSAAIALVRGGSSFGGTPVGRINKDVSILGVPAPGFRKISSRLSAAGAGVWANALMMPNAQTTPKRPRSAARKAGGGKGCFWAAVMVFMALTNIDDAWVAAENLFRRPAYSPRLGTLGATYGTVVKIIIF
jgi:hypothetical protein